jgi:PKD repeat protein
MKSLLRSFTLTIFALAIFNQNILQAQISQGGTPPGFILTDLPVLQSSTLSPPDMNRIQQEDAVSEIYNIARGLPANLNMQNSGNWYHLPDGSKIWRLKIKAAGAKALGLYYNQFWLPEQSKFYVYSEDKTQVIGTFNNYNNHPSGLFATELIKGETVILEYFQPASVVLPATINVAEVAYVYRGMNFLSSNSRINESGSCQVNVNCSEGSSWADQKRSVVRILLKLGSSYGWCTGALINNTLQNCTPYLLTADHCATGSSAADRNQWIFYFNYQAPGCSNPSSQGTLANQTMTGCVYKANSGGSSSTGSDFYLVQLNNNVPTNYNPFFAGWNRTTTGSSSGVGIHHPSGDIKKISTYNTAISAISVDGIGYTHWLVRFRQTTNGYSVPEQGSSGSPLFNSSGLIIGDLTGVTGTGGCSNPSDQLIYGRIYYSWDKNGTTATRRLKDWLDPNNSNVNTLAGTNAPCGTVNVNADFSGNPTTIFAGQSVNFTDLSSGNPTAWSWTFTGGTPGTSSVQNPQNIVYNTPGTYTVSLTASKTGSSDTETKTAYITVLVNSGTSSCDTLSNILPNHSLIYYTAGPGQGYVCGHNVYGDLAKADKFTASAASSVSKVFLGFAVAKSNSSTRTFNVRIWAADGAAGAPGTVLGTTTYKYTDAAADVAAQRLAVATFGTPVSVNGNFYAGIEFAYQAGDTLALISNMDGNTNPTTSWEKMSNGLWQTFNDGTQQTWQLNIAQFIMPEVCTANSTAPPTADFSSSNTTICAGSTVTFNDISTGNPTSWSWSFPGGTPSSSSQQHPVITYNTAGTYNVSLTATNANGNTSKTVNNMVTVRAKPNVVATAVNTLCSGDVNGLVNLSVSSGQSPYSFIWSNGATSQNISNLPAGAYTVTVTDANTCTTTATATVNEPAALNVTSNVINSSCTTPTGSIALTVTGGTGGYAYLWNTNATTQNLNNIAAGTYSVTVRDANNCETVKSIVVNSVNGPAVTPTIVNVKCFNGNDGSISLSVSGGNQPYTYQWSVSGTASSISNLSQGTYSYTVTDAQNCKVIQTQIITQPTELITYTTAIDTKCGQSNGSANVVAVGGTTPYTYTWSSSSTSSTITNIASGQYHVTVRDANNCESIKTLNIAASAALNVNVTGNNPTCDNPANGAVFTNVSQGTSPYTYLWSNSSQTVNQNNLASGTYTVTVTDAEACTGTGSINLSFSGAAVNATIQDVTGCHNNDNGSISLTVTNAAQPVTFTWSIGAVSSSIGSLSAGNYFVTITENSGCTHVYTYNVAAPDVLEINLSVTNATTGNNGSASVAPTGGTPAYNYLWSNGETTASVSNLAAGNYSVTVIDDGGCQQSVSFVVDFDNSIKNINVDGFISIYPNPNNGIFNIQCNFKKNENLKAEVFNALGAKVYEKIFTEVKENTLNMNLEDFPNSTYILKLSTNDWNHYRKIIKTRTN